MSRGRHVRGLAAVAAAGAVAGCAGPRSAVERELQSARAQWSASGVASYEAVQQLSCFCVPEVLDSVVLMVRADTIRTLTYAATGAPVDSTFRASFRTVTSLFDLIQDAVDQGAAEIRVSYHPELGYPAVLYIDYDQRIADEELRLAVHRLTPLR